MSFNGSGTFVINTAGQPVVANTVISATVFNALTADLATGLSTCITKDGQTTITANIPFGSNKITGLGAATAATDAATFGQVQSTAAKLITVTGTDTITGTMSPALTAYAAGQLFYFIANAANTGAMTINIDGLGAKAITRDGSTALIAGDVNTGEIVVICYDGTRFQMINAANSFGNTTINGTLTVTGNTGLQANVSITSTLSVGGTFAVTGAATLGSTLSVTGKSDLPVVSTASMNAAVAVITTGTVTNLTSTSASIASMNAGVALLTNATVTTLTATGASIASANIGNLQFTAASIASINAGVAVITNLTATSASIASMNAGVALLTTATVTSLTATGASIASANAGNLQVTGASVASANVGVALITTGTVTALTATGASIGSANVGTAVVTGLTVTNASIASANAGTATLSGNLTLSGGTANGVLYLNASKVATSGSALVFDGTNLGLGVTPSAWASCTALQIRNASLWGIGGSPTFSSMGGNYFYDGAYKYISSAQATDYYQFEGAHAWRTAASGTAGNAISFTIAMLLSASGNLGIGTSSPLSKLNAKGTQGNWRIDPDSVSGEIQLLTTTVANDGFRTYRLRTNEIAFDAGGAEQMRLTSTGLGIGTSSPASKLHVSNTAAATRITITDDVAAGRSGYIESNYSDALVIGTTSGVRGIRFSPDNTPRMFLDTAGNLGIGTSSPVAKLDVRGYAALVAANNVEKGISFYTGSGIYETARISSVNNVSYNDSGDIRFYTAGTSSAGLSEKMRLDTQGNLGLGVTPSAWGSGYVATQISNAVSTWAASGGSAYRSHNVYYDGSNRKYVFTGTAHEYEQGSGGHVWSTAASGTAGNNITFTQAMTLDASGNLGVGTTSPSSIFEVKSATPIITLNGTTNASARGLNFQGNGTLFGSITANYSTGEMKIASGASGLSNYYLTFFTDNTERARITSGGYFKASNAGTYADSTGAYHEFRGDQNSSILIVSSTSTGSSVTNIRSILPSGANASATYFVGELSGSGNQFQIVANGNVTNTNNSYGSISDEKTKQDIIDAASQWDDVKSLRVRKFRFKNNPTGPLQIGLVAQEAETVSPGLVDETVDCDSEGNDLGTTTKSVKYSVLYMKAVKALQEAMTRIEKLEAEVAALKGA